jgi:hypothetical protein
MDGVEYIEGTSGPRWVIPMSGVVVMVHSSARPGSNPGFNERLLSAMTGRILAQGEYASKLRNVPPTTLAHITIRI